MSETQLLFVDIETAPLAPDFESLDPQWKDLWSEKSGKSGPGVQEPSETYRMRAAVMAEFSRIICISAGYLQKGQSLNLHLESFYHDQEKAMLESFLERLSLFDQINSQWAFAGHNIREFDIPFICRRLLVHGMAIPHYMDFQKRKPWEIQVEDTLHYWRFGDYKHYTSLNLLAHTLNVPVDKETLDGSRVGPLYWSVTERHKRLENLRRIVHYCEKDVVTTVNVFLRLSGKALIPGERIYWPVFEVPCTNGFSMTR